jgi:hypothetical protein
VQGLAADGREQPLLLGEEIFQVGVLELEGGRDRPGPPDGLAWEGFKEGGLAALVLADEAGDVRLEPDDPRILDAPEFLN